ncbi:hypothetical protein [Pendulispora albinea]|uniref:Uncharacterized protein n=1 Tax=Pendulispora albinea TaxID=2741071 RepID=A0ABZ2LLQ9_9BACT
MRKRAKRPEWVRRIAAWDASGESAGEYAYPLGEEPFFRTNVGALTMAA